MIAEAGHTGATTSTICADVVAQLLCKATILVMARHGAATASGDKPFRRYTVAVHGGNRPMRLVAAFLFAALTFASAAAHADDKQVSLTFEGCTVRQAQQIRQAVAIANSALDDVIRDLSGSRPSEATQRELMVWFGDDVEPDRVLAMYRRMFDRIQAGKDSIAMACDLRESAFGWTQHEMEVDAHIGFGRAFFEARPVGGFDTRMGTVIHELSHMVPGIGTDDIVYGVHGARDLADANHYQAVRNADNVEYFIEALTDR